MKKYQLKTLKEIIEVVNTENIDCFIKDFTAWLGLQIIVKSLDKEVIF